MKKLFITAFCLSLAMPLLAEDNTHPAAAPTPAAGSSELKDDTARASYALGLMNGTQWRKQSVGIDSDLYIRGIKDGASGAQPLLTEEEAQQAIQNFKTQYIAKQRQKQAEEGLKNKAIGEAFMTTNKLAPGVKVLSVMLPNGQSSEMQYEVLKAGTGPTPAASDRVSVNYRGTLIDGTEFDSSYKRGQPATFPLNGVIKGWTEALKIMPVGSKWKLFIPAELAYGERSMPNIPANSTLIFEVELLNIEVAPPPPAPAAPLTSDIIKVPSAEELKKGAKIEVIKPEDVQKAQTQQTNKQ